ncbi:MAG: threonine--tRNA ligase [Proteobacteria bacterium]|nr:threonine--tRNA ligase [Pseudomonadota bacterium]
MISVTLPDGKIRELEKPLSGKDFAKTISNSLAKEVVAMEKDGEMVDISTIIDADCSINLIKLSDPQGLELLRHDCAHVMAEAVQELFPGTQVTIGPAIENGFYYDFFREEPFTTSDLAAIEKKMRQIIKANRPFEREEWAKSEAIEFFNGIGETFKAEIIEDLDEATVSIYKQGDWLDLCRGPHLPSTGKIGSAFKLMKVAGAYWRGNSDNEMLSRIYGTAWRNEKELDEHLNFLEEAEKRDHRKLAKVMDLFHFQDEAPGMAFWHPKGWSIYVALENFIRNKLLHAGYDEIKTPAVVDRKLWEASGHWEKYREHMFIAEIDEQHANDKRTNALKPMNCPCHVQIFNQGITSYKDLPIRFSEFGSCHRYEPSGTMHGLMRVRAFTQDDGHIFCTEQQIEDETSQFISLLSSVYEDLGFKSFDIRLSTRPEIRVGDDSVWDRSEAALEQAIQKLSIPYMVQPGEGAFYGPKLDFVLQDAIGREWQCGTFQLDFILPERLNAEYVNEKGEKVRPVMIHRAILGSFERFIGILLENYSGKLPLWLAPTQISILSVTEDANDYCNKLKEIYESEGIRVNLDIRNEKIGYKIREHSSQKTQLMAIIGMDEVNSKTVSIRDIFTSETETLEQSESISKVLELCKKP